MEGLRVKCCTCGSVDLYETTEAYDPDIPLTGDMLRLQKPYNSWNWPAYDGSLGDKSTSRFLMFCTRCGGYITANGKLDFVDEELTEPTTFKVTKLDFVEEPILNESSEESNDVEKPKEEFVCPFPGCGKVCGSKAGLGAHMRVHKTKE